MMRPHGIAMQPVQQALDFTVHIVQHEHSLANFGLHGCVSSRMQTCNMSVAVSSCTLGLARHWQCRWAWQ